MALSVTSVKDLGFVKQFKLSDGRVVRESELSGLGLSVPPRPAPKLVKTENEISINGKGHDDDPYIPPKIINLEPIKGEAGDFNDESKVIGGVNDTSDYSGTNVGIGRGVGGPEPGSSS